MRFAAGFCIASVIWAVPGPSIPVTPAGTVLSAWLDAFNSGNRARITDYLTKYDPEHKGTVDQLTSFRDQTGGFTLIRFEKNEPQHLEALVKEREGDNFALLTLDVTSADSPIVKSFGLHVVPARIVKIFKRGFDKT